MFSNRHYSLPPLPHHDPFLQGFTVVQKRCMKGLSEWGFYWKYIAAPLGREWFVGEIAVIKSRCSSFHASVFSWRRYKSKGNDQGCSLPDATHHIDGLDGRMVTSLCWTGFVDHFLQVQAVKSKTVAMPGWGASHQMALNVCKCLQE